MWGAPWLKLVTKQYSALLTSNVRREVLASLIKHCLHICLHILFSILIDSSYQLFLLYWICKPSTIMDGAVPADLHCSVFGNNSCNVIIWGACCIWSQLCGMFLPTPCRRLFVWRFCRSAFAFATGSAYWYLRILVHFFRDFHGFSFVLIGSMKFQGSEVTKRWFQHVSGWTALRSDLHLRHVEPHSRELEPLTERSTEVLSNLANLSVKTIKEKQNIYIYIFVKINKQMNKYLNK